MRRVVIGLIFLLAFGGVSQGQSVWSILPTDGVTFTSPSHTMNNADGSPVVTRYEFRFSVQTAGCPSVAAFNLGKPSADAQNLIQVKPLPPLATLPANCTYTGVVAAIGPGGEGVSAPTDPFARFVLTVPVGTSKPAFVR